MRRLSLKSTDFGVDPIFDVERTFGVDPSPRRKKTAIQKLLRVLNGGADEVRTHDL